MRRHAFCVILSVFAAQPLVAGPRITGHGEGLPARASQDMSVAGIDGGGQVFRISDGVSEAADALFTAPGLRLPATFRGTLPTASGPGAEWHLDLWPDQVFHLVQSFGDAADPVSDIGLWSADPARNAIVLQGGREAQLFLQVRGNGDLRLMDQAGAPIESTLNYTLEPGPLDPATVALPMQGLFRYMADAAVFEECLTGRTYPVAMEKDYIAAERAYLAQQDLAPGAPVFAVLEGQLALRPAMEGPDRMHLVIDRFSRLAPEQACAETRSDPALTNTFWRLVDLGGLAVNLGPQAREPFLVLGASGEETAYNATVGCNMIRGRYERDEARLTFGPGAMTMMACPPPLDGLERALAQSLGEAAGWQIDGSTLELVDKSGNVILRGEAVYLP